MHITYFITNHIVLNNFYNLLLFHKLSVKTKRRISILIISKWRGIMNYKKTDIKRRTLHYFDNGFVIIPPQFDIINMEICLFVLTDSS